MYDQQPDSYVFNIVLYKIVFVFFNLNDTISDPQTAFSRVFHCGKASVFRQFKPQKIIYYLSRSHPCFPCQENTQMGSRISNPLRQTSGFVRILVPCEVYSYLLLVFLTQDRWMDFMHQPIYSNEVVVNCLIIIVSMNGTTTHSNNSIHGIILQHCM